MTILFRGAIFVVLSCSLSSFAQPAFFGEALPATSTRYGTARGTEPLLLSNGHDPILFWSDGMTLRVARVVDGQATVSRAVLPVIDEGWFDAVWTGSHFLVVLVVEFETIIGPFHRIFGQLVSAKGEPLGDPFDIIRGEATPSPRNPRLAFNGERALLLYNSLEEVRALLLTPEGERTEASSRLVAAKPSGPVALTSNGESFAAVIPRDADPGVMLFDGAGEVQSESVLGPHGRAVSIATDGHRYLAVAACAENDPCGAVYARVVAPDGSLGPSVDVEPSSAQFPSAVWDDGEWVVSYARGESRQSNLHLVRLDSNAHVTGHREQREGTSGSLATIDGHAMIAWIDGRHVDVAFRPFHTIVLSALPLSASVRIPASLTATRQTLLATASSFDGTLIVWREDADETTTLRMGVRSRQGQWNERWIETVEDSDCCYEDMLAASNGQELVFLNYEQRQGGWMFRRFDSSGASIGDSIALDFGNYVGILWDGRDYLLIHEGAFAISRLSPSGTLSPAIRLPHVVGEDAIFASDGAGSVYAVWTFNTSGAPDHRPNGLAGIRLGSDFQPLDAMPITIGENRSSTPMASIVWDGGQYAIAWTGDDGVMLAHVLASGDAVLRRTPIPELYEYWPSLVRVTGGAAILWHVARPHAPLTSKVAVLRHDGTTTEPVTLDFSPDLATMATLPDGELACIQLAYRADAPYERVGRLAMTVGSPVPLPGRPRTPRARVQTRDETVLLEWDAVPFALGYRVEVRTGDGPWLEMERAFGADQHSVEVDANRQTWFRVRAWNDAGMGPYSAPVPVDAPRRRAVRK